MLVSGRLWHRAAAAHISPPDHGGAMSETERFPGWHGTTIVAVRKGGRVVVAGDGQVSLGQTVIKGTARKVRRLTPGGQPVLCGFAGSTADAFTLLERLEKKLEAAPGQLAARRGRARQGLAHRQVPAQPRGDADRHRRPRPLRHHRRRRRARARARRRRHRLRRQLRARRRPRALSTRTSTPRRSPAAPWRSPPRFCVYTNGNVSVESLDAG